MTLQLPALSEVPRESAEDTLAMATLIKSRVSMFLGAEWSADELDEARRRLATIASTVERRGLSRRGTAILWADCRRIERAVGAALVADGLKEWRQEEARQRWMAYATVSDEQWEDVLRQAVERADASPASVDALLSGVEVVEPEPEPEPEPVKTTMPEVLAKAAQEIARMAVGCAEAQATAPTDLTPEQAHDGAKALWSACVPVLALHKQLTQHGKR